MLLSRGLAAVLMTLTPAWADGVSVPGAPQPIGAAATAMQYAPGSSSGPGCAQATAYLARAAGETTHAADMTALICGLVSDGVWANLDALYVLAQQNATDALLNLVGMSYTLSNSGSAPFVTYKGFHNFAASGMLDTGFNPTTAPSPKMVPANACMGAWISETPDGGIQMGLVGGSSHTLLAAAYSGTQTYAYIAYAVSPNYRTPPLTTGLYGGDHSTSAGTDIYYNGSTNFNDGGGQGSFSNANMVIGGGGAFLSTYNMISAAHIGASLGAAGQLALYNRLRTYMTAVGVP